MVSYVEIAKDENFLMHFTEKKNVGVWIKISWNIVPQCPLILGQQYLPEPSSHNSDVIMGAMASQITSLTIVYSTVYAGADQKKYQSFASLAFVRGIHRWPVNFPHKWPVTRKMLPLDDVIMVSIYVGMYIGMYI